MKQVPFINAHTAKAGPALAARQYSILPAYTCDCHVHLFGNPKRYPLNPTRAYTPGLAEVADARALMNALGIERIVLVQPSAYGFDNTCLLDGLTALGPCARGVAVVRPDARDSELSDLHAAGIRGLRINYGGPGERNSGSDLTGDLRAYAALLAGTDWLLQVHVPAEELLAARDALLRAPIPLVIDHFANISASDLPDHPACALLETLLSQGQTYLKLSAPYRIAQSILEMDRLLRWVESLAIGWQDRLLWGSDWPHTPPHGPHIAQERSVGFREIDAGADLSTLMSWLGHADLREKVFSETPGRLFGFASGS